MTRLVLILLAIFLALTFLRSILRRYKINQGNRGSFTKPDPKKNNKKSDDDNIVDAKFEEIK